MTWSIRAFGGRQAEVTGGGSAPIGKIREDVFGVLDRIVKAPQFTIARLDFRGRTVVASPRQPIVVFDREPFKSLDTIYRTLRMLEEKGVISRVGPMRDKARFDANSDRHHHFVCSGCGLIWDFYSDALDRFTAPPEVSEMGKVDSVYVELRGLCRKCDEKRHGPKARGRAGVRQAGRRK